MKPTTSMAKANSRPVTNSAIRTPRPSSPIEISLIASSGKNLQDLDNQD